MYERFFGLLDLPFRLTPDPRYLFLSPKHADALAHLRLGLTESSGFVCITGEVGTGKTTLLRTFLDSLGPEVAVAYIFNPAVSAAQLVRRINRELGVRERGAAGEPLDPLDALNEHLLARRARGELSIVVIDEAQALAPDVLEQLRLLSNLETATEKLLRVVLVGQPQLRAILGDPGLAQLNQRITLRWHMGPLGRAETVAYVRHRLAIASRSAAADLFTRPALWLLHRRAGGVPRLVNMIAHRALLAAYAARARRVGLALVLQAYREIEAVPLPRPRRSRVRAVATTGAVAVAILAAIGAGTGLGLLVPSGGRTIPEARVAVVASEAAAVAPPRAARADLEALLRPTSEEASARTALGALFRAWHVEPLRPAESALPADLAAVAHRRELEHLALAGNPSVLAVFDLPALLELRIGDPPVPRYAALLALRDREVTLVLDGTTVVTDVAALDGLWFGQAHLLWRDFEALGATFGPDTRGPNVTRLQELLAQTGFYAGAATGQYDPATLSAVHDFQQAHALGVDGLVGRLTRIALYTAAGGYRRPTLAAAREAGSAEVRS